MKSIDISKIKLFQLRAFVAVADCSNFGGAAAVLELTQSSISHAIASLEDELGVMLLFRGRQGATLTPVGEQIVGEVRQMLQLLEVVVDKANRARGLESGQVRIASIRSIATHWLPEVIASFSQRFPQITVTLTKCFDYTEVQTALQNRSADIGLMDIYDRDGFNVWQICEDDYVALLPPNALPQGCQISWEQMSRYPLIMPASNDRGYAPLRNYIGDSQMPMIVAYKVNEDSTIVSMVAQGLGMAILPRLAALPIPETVQVHRLPKPLTRVLGAVILEDALHSPAVFAFVDAIKSARSGNSNLFTVFT